MDLGNFQRHVHASLTWFLQDRDDYLYRLVEIYLLRKFDHLNHTMALLFSPIRSHKTMSEMYNHSLNFLVLGSWGLADSCWRY